jgi:hypothetical protein
MKNNQCSKVGKVNFPKHTGININMMPFIMGDINSIPKEYRCYKDIINSCNIHSSEIGKIGYLTITESFVNKGKPQRRGGIHTEKTPTHSWGGDDGGAWGGKSGLFMASNISDSCQIWNYHVDVPGLGGDCSHLRDKLGKGIKMSSNELYWMTDSCPHESLELKSDCMRQFFRLVTSDVGVWYEKHSTKNKLGVNPGCKIIKENKFKNAS